MDIMAEQLNDIHIQPRVDTLMSVLKDTLEMPNDQLRQQEYGLDNPRGSLSLFY